MAETRGRARQLEGVPAETVEAFVDALDVADAALRGITGRLEGARVHDAAFGKLIDAEKVREAYHNRLPATEVNLAEALTVLAQFSTELAPPPPGEPSAAESPSAGPQPAVAPPTEPEQESAPACQASEGSSPDSSPASAASSPDTASVPKPRPSSEPTPE